MSASKTTRATKTATANATDAVIKNKPNSEDNSRAKLVQDLQEELQQQTERLWNALSFTPSPAHVTFLKLVSRVTLYALGFVSALYVTSWLSMILVSAGWPLFLVAVIEVISIVMGIIGSWMLSDKVVNYVADGQFSVDVKRASAWIKGKFADTSTFVKTKLARDEGAMVH